MPRSIEYSSVKEIVFGKTKKATTAILKYVKSNPPKKLWGSQKPRHFV